MSIFFLQKKAMLPFFFTFQRYIFNSHKNISYFLKLPPDRLAEMEVAALEESTSRAAEDGRRTRNGGRLYYLFRN
jgi:hypothetical protein